MTSAPVLLPRRLAAQFLGSAFLAAIVIGSGIAAQRLSPGDTGLELLENAAAAAAGLFAIILIFGPVPREKAAGGDREFAGSLGTQVVKIFDQAAARTGLRGHEAVGAGFEPVTVAAEADDHKAYYPGTHRIAMRFTGDRATGRLFGVQLFGHRHAEIAKRIDTAATAIYNGMTIDAISDLDLSYTPPLGSPWDAVQAGAQAWTRQARIG